MSDTLDIERLELAAAFQDPRCKRVVTRPMPGPMHVAQVTAILEEIERQGFQITKRIPHEGQVS